jgi:peptidoglycan/LPS O-acetylase OafA/YrhL
LKDKQLRGNMNSKTCNVWQYGELSEFRDELFGIAILGVMLGHGLDLYFSISNIWALKLLTRLSGIVGTQGFLFLSGIGLWFSCNKGLSLKKFYLRRATRILFPWIGIAIPLFFINDLIFNRNLLLFASDISTLQFWLHSNNGTWYISVTILLYILFPALFALFTRNGTKSFLVINAIFLIFLMSFRTLSPILYNRLGSGIGISQIPAFFAGIYVAQKVEKHTAPRPWHYLFVLISLIALEYSKKLDTIIAGYCLIAERLLGTVLACIPLRYIKDSIISRALKFCGSISLELYLAHVLLIPIFKKFHLRYGGIPSIMSGFPEYAVIVLLSFGISILYKRSIANRSLG